MGAAPCFETRTACAPQHEAGMDGSDSFAEIFKPMPRGGIPTRRDGVRVFAFLAIETNIRGATFARAAIVGNSRRSDRAGSRI